jgi:hypothetical protein
MNVHVPTDRPILRRPDAAEVGCHTTAVDLGRAPTCLCGRRADGIAVNYGDINAAEAANAELERRCTTSFGVVYSGADLLAFRSVDWQPLCGPCADDRATYFIDYDRIRTVEQALDWTLHLSGKTWFGITDWEDVVRDLFPNVRAA